LDIRGQCPVLVVATLAGTVLSSAACGRGDSLLPPERKRECFHDEGLSNEEYNAFMDLWNEVGCHYKERCGSSWFIDNDLESCIAEEKGRSLQGHCIDGCLAWDCLDALETAPCDPSLDNETVQACLDMVGWDETWVENDPRLVNTTCENPI
jgi:hypothetical protein